VGCGFHPAVSGQLMSFYETGWKFGVCYGAVNPNAQQAQARHPTAPYFVVKIVG